MLNNHQHKSSSAQLAGKTTAGCNGACLVDNRGLDNPVQRKANTTGLPDNLKSGIENLSGHSMDDVKVHYNSSQPAQLNAHAYAQGNQIHVASGQEKHVPHEAWHVVQQKQGRVKPTMQMKGKVNVNDDVGLEKEADVMGAKAAQLSSAVPTKHSHSVFQRAAQTDKAVFSARCSGSATGIAQRFTIPGALDELIGEVRDTAQNIGDTTFADGTGKNHILDGSEEWAEDTLGAANRKLNEWHLVKTLVQDPHVTPADAIHIGFGIDDTTDPDAMGERDGGTGIITHAAENKLVTGKFAQVNVNMQSALNQLCTGKRAHYLKGTLIARIQIAEDSDAGRHIAAQSASWQKGMSTRWSAQLSSYFKQGKKLWPNKGAGTSLRLVIGLGGHSLYDQTLS